MLKKAAALLFACASTAICISCSSTSSDFLFAAIPGSNQIVAYRENPNSGILTQLSGSPITAGQAVQSIVVHPSNKFLYTANSGEGDVSLYLISSVGVLTEVTPRTNVLGSPNLLAMDSAGSYLFVGNSASRDISVFSINSSTGALTPVGSPFPIGMIPINMAVSPSGGVLYVTGQVDLNGVVEAFTVTNGVLTVIAGTPFITGNNPYGLTIAPGGGFLYTANTQDNSISIFPINADGSLGQANILGLGGQYFAPLALQIDKSGKYMYLASQATSNLAGFSIGADGGLTLLTTSPFASGANPSVIATDPGGKYLFVGNQKSPAVIQSFSIDSGSGTLTSVATYSVASTPTSIVIVP
jgi:6-phosphogluconolactonase (cycloisomerase 2 family)